MLDPFATTVREHGLPPLVARSLQTLQVNVGKRCNQACRHCHVDAGPHQTGADVNMGADVARRLQDWIRSGVFASLDLTGGAPELNPHFRDLVDLAVGEGLEVMDRCNLSVLFEPGQEDLAAFLAARRVTVVASLPFYARERTDAQRGAGVFDKSIEGLRLLNEHGYGQGAGRELHLVYNPAGAYLPGPQAALEADFRDHLLREFDIRFDRLFCITNMPIRRFREWLERSGNAASYQQALLDAFNPAAVAEVMCRDLISVGPDGRLFDCDFNQMEGLTVRPGVLRTVFDGEPAALRGRQIATASHCFGCTAGAGSSCGGQVAQA